MRRVTSKPAQVLGFADRGQLKTGMAADICVFDPDTIAPRATYAQPCLPSQGVRHVIVNGMIALRDGQQTEARMGRFLRKREVST